MASLPLSNQPFADLKPTTQQIIVIVWMLIQLQPVAAWAQSPISTPPLSHAAAEASLKLDSTASSQGYRLGSGDRIQITVFGYEE